MVRVHPDRPAGKPAFTTRGSTEGKPKFIPDGKVGLKFLTEGNSSPLMFIENRIKEKEMS